MLNLLPYELALNIVGDWALDQLRSCPDFQVLLKEMKLKWRELKTMAECAGAEPGTPMI
jgi:hypothetical protein